LAYRKLWSAFAKDMAALGYQQASGFAILDTCFNLMGLQGIVPLPMHGVAAVQGGTSQDVDAMGILYVANVSHACLAFAANRRD